MQPVVLRSVGSDSAFAATGLTIVSDLPVYVQGDFNQVGSSVRLAICDRHRRPTAGGAAGDLHPVVDPGALTVGRAGGR